MILRIVKEIFFPRWCCGCNTYGTLLCEKCFGQLQFSAESNKRIEFLDSVTSLVTFEKISKSLIHQLKYKSVIEIAIVCARLMYMHGTFPPTDIVTCVPLHKLRASYRGFNQAEKIAVELSRLLKIEYAPLLKRIIHTKNLASVTDPEKRKNIMAGQFVLNNETIKKVENKKVLIIDDVWTTGATLEEAAKVLKSSGASSVHAATFAHGM